MNQKINKRRVNISHFIYQEQTRVPRATGELTNILTDLAYASKIVSNEVRSAGLVDILGETGSINVQGEVVQKIDILANKAFSKVFQNSNYIAGSASEEDKTYTTYSHNINKKYVVVLDPLDGSSNFDVNVSVGTIFAIYRKTNIEGKVTKEDFLQEGYKQVCAGYFLYGSSTVFVYTTGNGVNGFTLDPDIGEYILSHSDIKIPKKCKYYSINESYSKRRKQFVESYVNRLKKDHSARYIGSLVADFHRNLLSGGVFIYPSDTKYPKGKLRLIYEANQLAFIAEQAGGAATDGKRRILDIKPNKIHQRTPLIIGNKNDVELFRKYSLRKSS